jgi:phosphoglycerate dehydrogenase-like enzyme
MSGENTATVLLTDRAWPDDTVERAVLAAAGTGVVITPHIAFSSDASVHDLRRGAAEEVVRVLSGQPPRFPCNVPPPAAADGGRR